MASNYIKKKSEISIITPLFTSLLLHEKLIKSNHMFMNWIAHQGYALVFSSVIFSIKGRIREITRLRHLITGTQRNSSDW